MIEIEISPELITGMLRTGNEIHVRIEEGLPPEGMRLAHVSGDCGPAVRDRGHVVMKFDAPGPDVKIPVTFKNLQAEIDELRALRVQRLRLQPGDTVVIEHPYVLSDEAAGRIKKHLSERLNERLGFDVLVVVLEEGATMATVLGKDKP
jgi:hypothetical protein